MVKLHAPLRDGLNIWNNDGLAFPQVSIHNAIKPWGSQCSHFQNCFDHFSIGDFGEARGVLLLSFLPVRPLPFDAFVVGNLRSCGDGAGGEKGLPEDLGMLAARETLLPL